MIRKLCGALLLAALLIAGVAAIDEKTTTVSYRPSQPTTYQAKFGLAIENVGLKERVTCLFTGSETPQKCWTDRTDCTGTAACTETIKGKKGEALLWKSTCGGEGKTVIDGNDEKVAFPCQQNVRETIQCNFKGGNVKTEQSCYAEYGKCSGIGTCLADSAAPKGTKVTWKSSCGGYQTTIQDGQRESVIFDCGAVITAAPTVATSIQAAPAKAVTTQSLSVEATEGGGSGGASDTSLPIESPIKQPTIVHPIVQPPVVKPPVVQRPPLSLKLVSKASWTCHGAEALSLSAVSKANLDEKSWKAIADQACQGRCTDKTCGVAKFDLGTRRVFSTKASE